MKPFLSGDAGSSCVANVWFGSYAKELAYM